jgi:ribonuclease R
LLANRKVTEWVAAKQKEEKTKNIPFVYRVHDKPDPEKIQNFARFAARFGYKINTKTDDNFLQSMNEMIEKLSGKPEENMLSTLAIRTMAKALYSTKNIGHYGLGFENYTHFTSPIRRYPDLMVHRLLHQYLEGNFKTDKKELIEINAKHCSSMERLAQEAERASTKYKQVEYLSQRVGETFRAVISGFSESSMFVETEDTKCEGAIRFKNIGFDHITFIQDEMKAIGRRTKIEFRYGDVLQVKLVKADVIKRQIDFAFIEKI